MVNVITGSQAQGVFSPDPDHTRRWEGQLSKFTNVVKGWQYRWFVLDPGAGVLEYYLLEDRSGKCRASQRMKGAAVSPSQEDENTFVITFVSGESYKVRASSARERQVWVDRLRHCSFLHTDVGWAEVLLIICCLHLDELMMSRKRLRNVKFCACNECNILILFLILINDQNVNTTQLEFPASPRNHKNRIRVLIVENCFKYFLSTLISNAKNIW